MFSIIQAAGWPIWFLLAASVIAVALIIERTATLRRAKIVPPGLLQSTIAEYRRTHANPYRAAEAVHIDDIIRHSWTRRLVIERLATRRQRAAIPELLETAFPGERFRGEFHRIEHHLAHLASAFYASPFDEAAVASIDGFGD